MSSVQEQVSWPRLLRVARSLIRQVNRETPVIEHWSFGGGTALMLQIGHRESRDVDIFLNDPQLLAFLDPQRRDFNFEIQPSDYRGDGAKFLKFAFDGVGEIDFIVSQPKTAEPEVLREIEGEDVLLETVPEIIAKKIVYRGSSLQPRDVFDIAAAGERFEDAIVTALRSYPVEVAAALNAIDRFKLEFFYGVVAELLIRKEFAALANGALGRAREILRKI